MSATWIAIFPTVHGFENGIFSGLDWFPTLLAAAGNPNITEQLLRGVQLGDRSYKNHLDGYNQMDLLTGKGPSKRQEVFYFGGPNWRGSHRRHEVRIFLTTLGLARRKGHHGHARPDQSPPGSIREVADVARRVGCNTGAPGYVNGFFAREFWRFVLVQQYVEKLALTAVDYPPMQDPASFNLDAVKKKVDEMIDHPGDHPLDRGRRSSPKGPLVIGMRKRSTIVELEDRADETSSRSKAPACRTAIARIFLPRSWH